MSVDVARLQALREEVNRRHGQLSIIPALRADLHEKQIALIDGPSKRKAGLKGRREGKSTGAASAMLIKGFQNPELTIPFITLSRASAKRIMWGPLHRLNYKHTLGVNFNNTDLTATLPNGAAIWLCGANEEDDIEKIRGTDRGYPMAVIDEAASMGRHLRPLVEEVLDAALSDQDGELWMLGSAGVQCKGIFYEATTGKRKEWTSYHSTVLDNPYFPRWAGKPNWRELAVKFLADKRAAKGWAEDHPIYLREWMGQWVASDAGLVYRFSEAKNVISDAELEKVRREHDLQYILGVDLGYDDATAFCVVGFAEDLPDLYEIESYKQPGMIPSEIAEKVGVLNAKYHFRQMVADTGGLGKSIVEEFRIRHKLPIEAAEKSRKQEYIEMLNGELHTGRVHVRADSPLVDEWKNLRWDDDGDSLAEDDDDRIIKGIRGGLGKRRKEDARDENHISDSFLYSWRESLHCHYSGPPPKRPDLGSAEYYAAVEARLQEAAFAQVEREKRSGDGIIWEDKQ